ncbi:helix-turn-helix domain-containing protein [Staphylococcus simulans]|uniref:helix-turn-helix domain-containing protein n=4 Tax=Staphylococcus simulans TaxID=1286 RepID=UPI000D02ABCF|nr:helix-turn-helix transcriptional regulator [Staphylococcus simulans]AVO02822.1 hypothetical protein BI282_10505 [Staphylococcus simulans]AVO05768.1 hypothetical protein BI283_10465 [Staphylococcus simulans]AWG19370.1 hypothetical protein A9958_10510 [Staphylococcus simulans]AWI02319.1 hypothetical protein A7X73_10400 [Staphylococcus simulans]PTJ07243.1 XRE family transcriptional regulator [Staphylococcus simulans]
MIICTLDTLMKEKDVNQSRIVEETGITRPTLLTLIRNTNQSIRYETVNQLCNFFNIDMCELLVYSPVEVKLKEIIIEEIPISVDQEFNANSTSSIVSLIYNIDGDEFEFDTNLVADSKSNSLTHSKKMFFNSLVYEDVLSRLEAKGFNKNFLKVYNNSIDIEEKIKEKLKKYNLNTNFQIKNYEVEISPLKRVIDTSNIKISLEELKSMIKKMPFSQKDKEKILNKINEVNKL